VRGNRRGRIEAATRRRGGWVGSGRRCSSAGVAPAISGGLEGGGPTARDGGGRGEALVALSEQKKGGAREKQAATRVAPF
jgi:hypothetical protein